MRKRVHACSTPTLIVKIFQVATELGTKFHLKLQVFFASKVITSNFKLYIFFETNTKLVAIINSDVIIFKAIILTKKNLY